MNKQRDCNIKRQRGFTLIEIIMVLAIIAVLMAMILPNLVGHDKKARIIATKGNMQTISTNIRLFRTNEGRYPKDDLSDLLTETFSDGDREIYYMQKMPTELITSSKGVSTVTNTLGTSGGWYFDPKTVTLKVNYNKDLDDTWGLKDGDEKNPTKW